MEFVLVVKLLEPELAPILNGSVSADEAIEASRYQLKQAILILAGAFPLRSLAASIL